MIIFVVENLSYDFIMITYPNAKINLGLNIISKRSDGYHDINSIFYPIKTIFDILEILPSKMFSFSSSGIAIPDGKNICITAFELIRRDYNISNVKIHLHKQIPIGAGLGGGSSDGAFTLLSLNKIFNLSLSDNQLRKYALELGADSPFFIENIPTFNHGIGEKMSKININLSSFKFKFFFPDLHISTAEAYSNLNFKSTENSIKEIIKQPIRNWKNILKNDFEISVFNKYPDLKKVKERFYNEGALYSSMTGSGSVIYAIFDKD
ncbi:4-(cytidine 5'-diphospho)-2-C-methyl-D-erythritol kinase [Flavobacteriales bacterium]|nr:4-(cytidine 5'-diphospho)-2-C-methyl-D-erythritol kinase [Flavobacteriales bacterium]MDC0909140.1 4-(cytidine 5'-diphospho)-2-C-methyl-D-erythritol kinase [Flavobacteriales bacterium]